MDAFKRISVVVLTALLGLPAAVYGVENVPFSWNRGWPDGGRALSSGVGATYLNPALAGNSKRYVGALGGQSYPPNADYRLSAGIGDSQSSTLAGELVYEWERNINGPLPTGSSHRVHMALSEQYTDTMLVGIKGDLNWPDVEGANPGLTWGYGFGVQANLADGVYLALVSGDWFQKGDDPFLIPEAAIGLGLIPAKWFSLALDGIFRWGQQALDKQDKGTSVGLSAGIAFLIADRVAWRLGYNLDRRITASVADKNDHTFGTSLELPVFPWSFALDGRWSSRQGWSTGLSVMHAFFYEE